MQGCTDEEIQALMDNQNVKRLPQLYIDFLKMMGKDYKGYFMKGGGWLLGVTEHLYEELLTIRRYEFAPRVSFHDDLFVFVEIDQETYACFQTDNESDNPPVFYYGGDSRISRPTKSLSEFFTEKVHIVIESRWIMSEFHQKKEAERIKLANQQYLEKRRAEAEAKAKVEAEAERIKLSIQRYREEKHKQLDSPSLPMIVLGKIQNIIDQLLKPSSKD